MSDTTGGQLLADGDPIRLSNGQTVTVRFTFRSLVRLEESFGSFAEMETALSSQQMSGVLRLLSAGLLHEHDGQGAPLTPDRVGDLLPLTELQSVMRALEVAMRRDFPTMPAAAQPAAGPVSPLGLPLSPGTTGGTPAPSPSDATLASSGA